MCTKFHGGNLRIHLGKLEKGTRVLCPRGTETPRFVPVYPRPGDTFSQTPTVNLSMSLAICVQSITLKLFETIVLCWEKCRGLFAPFLTRFSLGTADQYIVELSVLSHPGELESEISHTG